MSLRKLCVFLFVNCIFIFRIANTFVASYAMKYSEIFFVIRKFLAYTPPQLYMLATALYEIYSGIIQFPSQKQCIERNYVRGGPLEIPGGGVKIPPKKFVQREMPGKKFVQPLR